MRTLAVIGGGAAGVFCAAALDGKNIRSEIFDAAEFPLQKVRQTGGGRCNFTNSRIVSSANFGEFYPRGANNMRKLVSKFDVDACRKAFERFGVRSKVEPDGRVFPESDSADFLADKLINAACQSGARFHQKTRAVSLKKHFDGFVVAFADGSEFFADCVLVACGGVWNPQLKMSLENLGHGFAPFAPSLFAMSLAEAGSPAWAELSGLSMPNVQIGVKIGKKNFSARGDILFAHFGISGPATLALSAFAALELLEAKYSADLFLRLFPDMPEDRISKEVEALRNKRGASKIKNVSVLGIPSAAWLYLLKRAGINPDSLCSEIPGDAAKSLRRLLSEIPLRITGKPPHKGEFVTCGGIERKSIDFSTMESRLVKNLYFAGECIDIDGITGGFNLHAAWATGAAAGGSLIEQFL